MFPEQRNRGWRQRLADGYEKKYGVSISARQTDGSTLMAQRSVSMTPSQPSAPNW